MAREAFLPGLVRDVASDSNSEKWTLKSELFEGELLELVLRDVVLRLRFVHRLLHLLSLYLYLDSLLCSYLRFHCCISCGPRQSSQRKISTSSLIFSV